MFNTRGDSVLTFVFLLALVVQPGGVCAEVKPGNALGLERQARTFQSQGKLESALDFMLRALAVRMKKPEYSSDTATALRDLSALAGTFQEKKNYVEAQRALVPLLDATRKIYGADSMNTSQIYSFLGDVCYDGKEYDKSIGYYSASEKVAEKAQGTLDGQLGCHMGDPVIDEAFRKTVTAACKKGMADCYVAKKDYEAAGKLYAQVVETIASFKEADRPKELTTNTVKSYGALLRTLDREAEAVELEQKYMKGVREY